MAKYLYKNIVLFQTYGKWHANYYTRNGKCFALHRCACSTKAEAYLIAKEQIDYLNIKGCENHA